MMNINSSVENGGNAGQFGDQAAATGRRNPPLSDTALVLLSAAANRESASILPAPADLKARGGALKAVLNHLLARGLVEEFAVDSDAESWRRDDDAGRIGLRITAAGCAAIAVETVGDGPAMPDADRPAGEIAASDLATVTDDSGIDGDVRCGDETDATDDPLDRTITWTDGSEDVACPESGSNSDRVPTGLSSARSPSKQDQIMALLSRQEGASVDALMVATGWLPHTVRAVLSGLRKKGHRIHRQKDGDADSVYRILPSPNIGNEPVASDAAD